MKLTSRPKKLNARWIVYRRKLKNEKPSKKNFKRSTIKLRATWMNLPVNSMNCRIDPLLHSYSLPSPSISISFVLPLSFFYNDFEIKELPFYSTDSLYVCVCASFIGSVFHVSYFSSSPASPGFQTPLFVIISPQPSISISCILLSSFH